MDAKEEYNALMRMHEKAFKALKAIDFLDTTRQLGLKGRRLTKSLRHFYETTDVRATFDALHWYVAKLDAELDQVSKKAEAGNAEEEPDFSDALAKVHSLLSDKGDRLEITGTDEDHIWFRTKTFRYEVCVPHEGNDYSWLFRKASIKGFDRWANSTAEESFFKEFERLVKRIERI